MLPDDSTPYGVFDPIRTEWATPTPCVSTFSQDIGHAARFSYFAAIEWARGLIGESRPWLLIQPFEACAYCGMVVGQ